MNNYTFQFKPTSEIKDKFRTISVEAKDKVAAKKKLLKELTKVNSDTIDVIKTEDYNYNKYSRLDLQLLIDDLQILYDFYPCGPDDAEDFANNVAAVIAHLQKRKVKNV